MPALRPARSATRRSERWLIAIGLAAAVLLVLIELAGRRFPAG